MLKAVSFGFTLFLLAQTVPVLAGETTNTLPGTTVGDAKVKVTTDAAGKVTGVKVEAPDIAAKNGGATPVANLKKASSGTSADGKLCTETWCGEYLGADGKPKILKICTPSGATVNYAATFKVILFWSKDKPSVTASSCGQIVEFTSKTGFKPVQQGQPPQPPPAVSGEPVHLDPPTDTDPDYNLQWQPGADCIGGMLDIPGNVFPEVPASAGHQCNSLKKCFVTYLYAKKAGDKDADKRTVWAVVKWGHTMVVCVNPDSLEVTQKPVETIPSDVAGAGGGNPDKNKDIDPEMKKLDDQLKDLNKKNKTGYKSDTYKSDKK